MNNILLNDRVNKKSKIKRSNNNNLFIKSKQFSFFTMEIEPDELSKTPQELINMLKIEHMSFENPQSSYQSLTHFVNQITKQYRCPTSVDCTGIYRKNQIYRCRFGDKSPKTNCICYVTFMCEYDGSYTFSDAFWYHNHEINSETFDAHFCTLTTDELNKV